MRVLVTGGCGLIGYHTCLYYARQGHSVVSIDNLERSSLLGHKVSDARHFFNKNALDKEGVVNWPWDVSVAGHWDGIRVRERFDLVVHLAGQCGVPTSINDPARDFQVNAVGTLNALEYCRKVGATLILASTNKVYPIHEDPKKKPTWVKWGDRWVFQDMVLNSGIPVDHPFKGARTPYGNSKYAADLMCQEWSHTYGIRTGVFRMSCIYGPNQFGFEEQGWATWFAIAAMKGYPITIYGDGHQVRDMLYVEDCVNAYDAFVRSDLPHGVFNLGGGMGNTLSLSEHLSLLEERLGKKIEVKYADWRPLDQKCYISDISKFQASCHWEPVVSPQEGMERVIEWVGSNLEVF